MLFIIWALGALLGTQSLAQAQNTQKDRPAAEEIYVVRSVRESRIAPTDFCAQAKTGFNSTFEDHYTLRSTATRSSDGRMVDTNVKTIGTVHGCIGPTADPAILNVYLDVVLGRTAFSGTGDCRQTKSDFPERGLSEFHCFLNLSDPLGHYVGGLLTSSSMTSLKSLGAETDPPGYTQTSIATIPLWRNAKK